MNNSFRFAPELFEYKSKALEILADNNLVWMIDFSGIDVIHDIYGLEVEGVRDEETANKILRELNHYFYGETKSQPRIGEYARIYQEYSGWVVEIASYPHPKIESWMTPED
jgi:hypothetical protein